MLLKMIRLDSLFLSTIRRKLWLVAQKLRASNKANPYLASYTYRSKEAANLSKNESEGLTELITTSTRKNDEKPAPIK